MSISLGGLILHKVLSDPENSIETWSHLKSAYFTKEYSSIYNTVNQYYEKYNKLPCFNDLTTILRETTIKSNIVALSNLSYDIEIDSILVLDALLNEYTQSEIVKLLDIFLENLALLDSEEIKIELSNMLLTLEEKTDVNGSICYMDNISIITEPTESTAQVPLGISNYFDAEIKASTSELILLGGMRGAGKSIVATNIVNNQYINGNVGLMFSIEMTAREVFNRSLSALSGVPFSHLRNSSLSKDELDKLAKVRYNMFENGEEIYSQYTQDKNFIKFEDRLTKKGILKRDNQLIFIDNHRLTIGEIDATLGKFKAKHGEKLKTVVVDYINVIETKDQYDWKSQIELSKHLKNLAKKYNVVMFSPYQIDDKGGTRFSKGLLDSCDIAMLLKAEANHLTFTSTKTRNTKPFEVCCPIEWETLTIDPREVVTEEEKDTSDETLTTAPKSEEDMPF